MEEVEQHKVYKTNVVVERQPFRLLPLVRKRVTSIFLFLMLLLIAEFIAAGFGLNLELPIMLTILTILVLTLVISIADRWNKRN